MEWSETIPERPPRSNAIVVWLGNLPHISFYKPEDGKHQDVEEIAELIFSNKKEEWLLQIRSEIGNWLFNIMPRLIIGDHKPMTFNELRAEFHEAQVGDFNEFIESNIWKQLLANGLLVL